MKKFFAIIMAICLLASTLCFTVLAAEEPSVLKIQYDSKVEEFSVFEDGWNYAMETAKKGKAVTVTLLKDWVAKDGQFSDDFINGPGFDSDTIYFANDVNFTLDLGGHTIDRALTLSDINGEVIFINDDANVTIKNGTIKGGYSNSGAGGIHIEGAKVSLIDLVLTNNRVINKDGSAIQHDGGGELYMKNCSIVDNDGSKKGLDINGTVNLYKVDKVLIEDCRFADNDNIDYGAGIHADACGPIEIKNTTFENLHAGDRGGAIWAGGKESPMIITNCKFINNSAGNWGGAICTDQIEIFVYDSEFIGNCAEWDAGAVYLDVSAGSDATSYFYRCTFDGNIAGWDGGAIYCNANTRSAMAKTYGCTFTNNSAGGYGGAVYADLESRFEFCSDDETGTPGIIKNNRAGKAGGGTYVETNFYAYMVLGGEIYVSGNTSGYGADDIYVENGNYIVLRNVTSPAGSIGVRHDDNVGMIAKLSDQNTMSVTNAFFANNEGYEVVVEETEVTRAEGVVKVPCFKMVKSTTPLGSIFGEGSLTMLLALLAVIVSVASAGVCISLYKKKLGIATVADDSKDNV